MKTADKGPMIDAMVLIRQLTARETLARDAAISEAKYGDRDAAKRWLAKADQLAEVVMLIDGLSRGSEER